ncbi:MAG: N-formylglutamate amidohydrolase [Alphaproteobacteria bacterium]|nr:N-formylglutamate amidohydrolase [Alphaproteobacteria bacterium]
MALAPFTIIESSSLASPLVVDSPHSGRIYPADFDFTCPLPLLRQTEDFRVDELVMGASESGASVLKAEFPRSYIDTNRAEDDLDPALLAEPWPAPLMPEDRTLLGLGLVRRLCKSGVPVYRAPLSVAEVQKRIVQFYRPYHAALEKLIAARIAKFGTCYLINAHSMPGWNSEDRRQRRPDFVLGDRNGTSCDPSFTRRVRDLLQDMGFTVALNVPYKGMEIVRRYGKPHAGRQALQLEINRQLYMNEGTLETHEGFPRLQRELTVFFTALAAELRSDRLDLAAE